jgi:hypothetical protein
VYAIAALNAFQRDINDRGILWISGTGPARIFNCDPVSTKKTQIDFVGKTGIRFSHENRSAIFPERFLIAIVIAIAISKSGSDFQMKIADRISYENRDPILRTVCTFCSRTGFPSRIDFEMEIGIRF